MPKPSFVDSLSPEERQALEQELIRRNFADYDGLVDWAASLGLEISRSAAHRFGSKIKRRLQALKDSTDAARMIAEAAPDDSDLRSNAVISMLQSELFEVMVSLQDLDTAEPGERVMILKEASKSVLDMTKASTMQKKFMQEMEAKIRKQALEEASAKAADAVKRQGWTAEMIENLKGDIMGVPNRGQ